MLQIESKSELRKYFKEVRQSLSNAEKADKDTEIFHRFISLKEYEACEDLLVYVSSDIEVGTYKIIEYALCHGKNVLCPRCEKGSNLMYFYQIYGFECLESGSFGILEPVNRCRRVMEFVKPLCIVPGLSFDQRGYRLGFGKGFYDRFLADFSGYKIGLCYESCLSEILPSDEFDINVNRLVTESKSCCFEPKRKD